MGPEAPRCNRRPRRGVMVENYDQMIGEGNTEGNATAQKVVDRLLDQTKSLERAVGSDCLDSPDKVKGENKSSDVAMPATPQQVGQELL